MILVVDVFDDAVKKFRGCGCRCDGAPVGELDVDALRALELTIRQRLGTTARYSIAGERVTVTLTGATPEALAQWLAQARVNARALPAEARLKRTAAGQWDGTLVMTLPPR